MMIVVAVSAIGIAIALWYGPFGLGRLVGSRGANASPELWVGFVGLGSLGSAIRRSYRYKVISNNITISTSTSCHALGVVRLLLLLLLLLLLSKPFSEFCR